MAISVVTEMIAITIARSGLATVVVNAETDGGRLRVDEAWLSLPRGRPREASELCRYNPLHTLPLARAVDFVQCLSLSLLLR